MRLTELNVRLKQDILVFDCPCGKCGGRIRVPIGPERTVGPENPGGNWKWTGDFPTTISLEPSVDSGHWHGNITNGEAITIQ